MMKQILSILFAAALVAACGGGETEKELKERATELCRYVPDHELQEAAKDVMTTDFYAVLDTMFHHLPEHDMMDHDWLYYFVTCNGGTMPAYEVTKVELTDDTHAVATILVRQQWEDGTLDETSDVEEHHMLMERVDGVWLMSDFDAHKDDCMQHIRECRMQ